MTKATETELREKVGAIHSRVYNGIPAEIRQEVAHEMAGMRKLDSRHPAVTRLTRSEQSKGVHYGISK